MESDIKVDFMMPLFLKVQAPHSVQRFLAGVDMAGGADGAAIFAS